MDENGKMYVCFIEPAMKQDDATGLLKFLDYYNVWADQEMKDVISNVKGVENVCVMGGKTHFYGFIR